MKETICGMLCFLASILLLTVGILYYFPRLKDYHESKVLYEEISEEYTTPPEEDEIPPLDMIEKEVKPGCIDVDSEGLLMENEDYIGWIYVPRTDISYPVVKSRDNKDYLHTNFQKRYSFPGTIFMDYRCEYGLLNKHTILYGHNMKNGTMFAQIRKYKDTDYAKEHPVFWFIAPEKTCLYRVFSAAVVSPYDKFAYSVLGYEKTENPEADKDVYENAEKEETEKTGDVGPVLHDEVGAVESYQEMIKSSIVEFPSAPDEDDYVMTLSTCTGNSSTRFVLHGYLQKVYEN